MALQWASKESRDELLKPHEIDALHRKLISIKKDSNIKRLCSLPKCKFEDINDLLFLRRRLIPSIMRNINAADEDEQRDEEIDDTKVNRVEDAEKDLEDLSKLPNNHRYLWRLSEETRKYEKIRGTKVNRGKDAEKDCLPLSKQLTDYHGYALPVSKETANFLKDRYFGNDGSSDDEGSASEWS